MHTSSSPSRGGRREFILPLAGTLLLSASLAVAQEPAEAAAPEVPTAEAPAAPGRAVRATGVLVGVVYNKRTGEPATGVTVRAGAQSVVTDMDGRFRLERLVPGVTAVTFEGATFRETEIPDVLVKDKGLTRLDYLLAPLLPVAEGDEIQELDVFQVTASEVRGSDVELVAKRQEAAASVDFMSSGEMNKFSINDAADAMARVTGISISDTKFAVVRGLGDRYTNTQLNGMVQPSTDPDRQGVQLDIFPSKLLNNITTQKTFTPDQPGDSTGGSINLETRMFPEEFSASLAAGIRVNDQAWNADNYPKYGTFGNKDQFALGSQDRATPNELKTPVPHTLDFVDGGPLGYKFNGSYGDLFKVGGRDLGVLAGVSYDSGARFTEGHESRYSAAPGDLARGVMNNTESDNDYIQAREEVLIGLLGGVAYKISPDHKVGATVFASQSGLDVAKFQYNGLNRDDEYYTRENHFLSYKERELQSYQLKGEHLFADLGEFEANWKLNYSENGQDEPDQRITRLLYSPDEQLYYVRQQPQGLDRSWRTTEEKQPAALVDFKLPFDFLSEQADAKAGLAWQDGSRDYVEYTTGIPQGSVIPPFQTYDEMEDFVHSGAVSYLPANSGTAESERTIQAAYGMVELPMGTPKLKFVGGVRVEQTEITSEGAETNFGVVQYFGDVGQGQPGLFIGPDSPYYNSTLTMRKFWRISDGNGDGYIDTQDVAPIDQTDVLPSLGMNWAITDKMNLRAAYTHTVARPSYREIGAYFTQDVESDDVSVGNINLKMSEIVNYDLRWEWFFDRRDILAVSPFYKEIDQPIEQIYGRLTSDIAEPIKTWYNNPNTGEVFGVELEARKGLEFIADWLKAFSLGGNFTWIEASVGTAGPEAELKSVGYGGIANVPTERRLFDQPEMIINGDLTYEQYDWGTSVTIAYYRISDVLAASGGNYSFDIYNEAYDRWDLTIQQSIGWGFKAKFTATNLLNPERRQVYDPEESSQEYVRRTWSDGRGYSLTLSYDF